MNHYYDTYNTNEKTARTKEQKQNPESNSVRGPRRPYSPIETVPSLSLSLLCFRCIFPPFSRGDGTGSRVCDSLTEFTRGYRRSFQLLDTVMKKSAMHASGRVEKEYLRQHRKSIIEYHRNQSLHWFTRSFGDERILIDRSIYR